MADRACIFCRIGSGEVPSEVLYRDGRCFVVRDIHPRAPVHLLVIPLEHFTYLTTATEEKEPLLGHLLAVAGRVAQEQGVVEQGYRLVVNQGPASGQEVEHLHVHLLGGRKLGAMG